MLDILDLRKIDPDEPRPMIVTAGFARATMTHARGTVREAVAYGLDLRKQGLQIATVRDLADTIFVPNALLSDVGRQLGLIK